MKVLPDRIYGIGIRKIKNEDVNFASRERALIDVFDSYDVKKAFAILKEQKQKIDIPVFVDYVAHYPVQIIRRRIGYFLEELGVPNKFLNEIDVGYKGYSLLYDTITNTGKADKRWRIIVNG
jgi:predicted transcriptional regulator of viral defense system